MIGLGGRAGFGDLDLCALAEFQRGRFLEGDADGDFRASSSDGYDSLNRSVASTKALRFPGSIIE